MRSGEIHDSSPRLTLINHRWATLRSFTTFVTNAWHVSLPVAFVPNLNLYRIQVRITFLWPSLLVCSRWRHCLTVVTTTSRIHIPLIYHLWTNGVVSAWISTKWKSYSTLLVAFKNSFKSIRWTKCYSRSSVSSLGFCG